jgi:hypothetical protein
MASFLAVAAIALAGASSALAAAPTSTSLDADFSFYSGSTQYVVEIDGTLRDLDTKVGSQVTVQKITRTTVYESGVYAGETMSVTSSRSAVQPDGTIVIDTVVNTRSTVGDDPCTYRMVLRLLDYEAVVLHETSTCL